MSDPVAVGIVGSGPAVEAVEAALSDVDAAAERIDGSAAGSVEFAVAVGPCGVPTFDRVQGAATGRWIAVELGGVGCRPVPEIDAGVSVLDPVGGCFRCLRTRVESNADGPPADAPRTTRRDARLAGAVAGRLAASLVRGTDVRGRVVELPYVERRLLPVPGCDCDPSSPWTPPLDRTHADVDVEAAVGLVDGAIDDRTGIVREIGEAHSFPAPYYLATLCDTSGFSDAAVGTQAAGVATDWNPAFVKAVGEALERYSAGVYREADFEVAPAATIDDAVPPSSFVLPSAYDAPNPDEPIPWVAGESLHDERSVRLPAEFVVFPPPERRHAPSITTGLGLGSSGVGALLSGLYEVVERDATMLSWYSTFEPLGLSVTDPEYDELVRRARAEELAVTPLLVTQDVDVPVVTVAVHGRSEWPRFAVGSDADLDPVVAARAALAEALQNWMELRAMGPEQAREDPSAIADYAEFPRAAREFVDVEATVEAADVGPTALPTGTDELDAALARIEGVGLEAYAARLTPRDVESLGFEAVRVLVPGAQPLFTGEAFFGERAESVPLELGFQPELDRPHHPYP